MSFGPQRNGRRTQPARRVAIFTGNYDLVIDGVALILNRLVSHLESLGSDVLVFAPTSRRPGLAHTGTLVSVPSIGVVRRSPYRISLALSRSARKRLADFGPTLIHIATPDLLGYGALRLARRWGVPAVASYHTHFSPYLRFYHLDVFEGLLLKYLRWFYRECDQVYVGSPTMAEVLEAHGIGGEHLKIWEAGVDTSQFSPQHRSLEWRRAHGVADSHTLVTFVGRLVKEKGLDTFVKIIQALQGVGLPHRSMVVGQGPELAKLTRRLPNTIFTGFLTGQALSHAFASSDIFLFPGAMETFGMATLEAMASGLPAVCADATGSNSLVIDGVTGFLAPAADAAGFTERCARLMGDESLRSRLGSAARKRALRYEWHTVMQKIDSYYDQVLAAAPIASPLAERASRLAELAGPPTRARQ